MTCECGMSPDPGICAACPGTGSHCACMHWSEADRQLRERQTGGTTVRPVARPRGELTDRQRTHLLLSQERTAQAEESFRLLCVEMIEASSFREVAEVTGLSTNTLQRWKREAQA